MKWILEPERFYSGDRRSPHGERGLKSDNQLRITSDRSRSPHGERGLKYVLSAAVFIVDLSLPARGAWIEICWAEHHAQCRTSLPARGAWIEIGRWRCKRRAGRSLPARGAWIEITFGGNRLETVGRRSPHGERGLKFLCYTGLATEQCRSPHGERGLKY